MVYEIKGLDKESIIKVSNDFTVLLDRLGYSEVSKSLNYVTRELIHNAVKANMKRVFINENSFIEGENIVEKFRDALAFDSEALAEKLKQSDMFVKIEFIDMKLSGLLLRVQNNADMRPEEIEFVDSVINAKEEKDWEYNLDKEDKGHREGGGIGLRSIMTILKKTGLSGDSLSYSSGNGKTVFELHVKKFI